MKRLKAMTAKAEMEFAIEVEILGRVRHKNLLSLRGFYAGGDERRVFVAHGQNRAEQAQKCEARRERRRPTGGHEGDGWRCSGESEQRGSEAVQGEPQWRCG